MNVSQPVASHISCRFRFLMLLMLLFMTWSSADAQNYKVSIFERFEDNDREWYQPDGARFDFANERLRFEHSNDLVGFTWQDAGEPGYYGQLIFVTTRHYSGNEESSYGILFGCMNSSNTFAYLIAADGTFQVCKWVDGEYSEITTWTKNEALNVGTNAVNHLLIKNQGGAWQFYANGIRVDSMDAQAYFGNNTGLAVENVQTVDFSRFLVANRKTRVGESEFSTAIGRLIVDFKNDFANSIGDTTERGIMPMFSVKAPLPGLVAQKFFRLGGVSFEGTVGFYPSYVQAVDAFSDISDQISVAPTGDCLLIDAGRHDEGLTIERNTWFSLESLTQSTGPYERMAIILSIEPPKQDSTTAAEKNWRVDLDVIHELEDLSTK